MLGELVPRGGGWGGSPALAPAPQLVSRGGERRWGTATHAVCLALGDDDGLCDGECDGLNEGDLEGHALGEFEGLVDGHALGDWDGLLDGATVGNDTQRTHKK